MSLSNVRLGQTVYMGVSGAGSNSSYTILASVDPRPSDNEARAPLQQLFLGVPQVPNAPSTNYYTCQYLRLITTSDLSARCAEIRLAKLAIRVKELLD